MKYYLKNYSIITMEIDIIEDLCCICLDDCVNIKETFICNYSENDEINTLILKKQYVNMKCCNCPIHKKCLLLLFLNDFLECPLCRCKNITITDYYKYNEISKFLTISELYIYKNKANLNPPNGNIFHFWLHMIPIHFKLFIDDPIKYFVNSPLYLFFIMVSKIIVSIFIAFIVYICFYLVYLLITYSRDQHKEFNLKLRNTN